MAIGAEGNIQWVDGLRGIASLLVVTTHICRAFYTPVFPPSDSADTPPRFVQLPFVRVLFQGRIGVATFSLVTGYVCALKPLRLASSASSGGPAAALAAVAKSGLRRVPRLVLPVTLSTALFCLLAQLDAFAVARHYPAGPARFSPVPQRGGWPAAARALVREAARIWVRGESRFDPNMWSMMPLLTGTFLVYVYVVVTAQLQRRFRIVVTLAMYVYFYFYDDPDTAVYEMQFIWGVLLADLQLTDRPHHLLASRPLRLLSRVAGVGLLVLGLAIASYPDAHPEWQPWSKRLHRQLAAAVPAKASLKRFSTGLGLDVMALAVPLLPAVRAALTHRACLWLGRHSFAVYLLHGMLWRVVVVWALYGPREPAHTKTLAPPRPWHLVAVMPLFGGVLYGAAMLWTDHVDPWCARATDLLVARVTRARNEPSPPLLPLKA